MLQQEGVTCIVTLGEPRSITGPHVWQLFLVSLGL
jgi:hypothetical protein